VTGIGPGAEALPRWFERAPVRPLSAEEMLASVVTATGFDGKVPGDTEEYVRRYFGEPTNGLGDFQGGLTEHLFLNHSGQFRAFIQRRKGNLADRLLTGNEPPEKRVEALFLAVLSRPPSDEERRRLVAHLASPGAKPDALIEEAIWALLNCSEFRFRH
jgi:hypothetical protein